MILIYHLAIFLCMLPFQANCFFFFFLMAYKMCQDMLLTVLLEFRIYFVFLKNLKFFQEH